MRLPIRAPMKLAALLTAAILGCTAFGMAQAADFWRAYTYNAVATVTAVKGLNAMFEDIKKQTGGQLSVRLNLGGTLPITATNITQAVADNVVQLGDDAFFVGSAPVGAVVRLPLLIRSMSEFEKAWDIEAPYLRDDYAKKDVVILGRYIFPYNVLWSRKKLTSLADISGQKIRVIAPEQADFIKMLGGIPVTLGTAEVAAALDRGVIDGAITASSGYGYVWRDLLKYSYRLNISFIDSLILVNKGVWDKLPPDTRKTVQAIVDDHTRRMTNAMAAEEDEMTRKLASEGMVVTEPSKADIATAEGKMAPYWKSWAGSRPANAQEAMQKILPVIGR
ncbi:TRAP transporter substrate-binding protein DctP [Variovorax sp. PBL-E5]|uniref:TRAP transporter substrate-binding protein DctP n=1 Tax=Variovorax sp. PBL-E5 TaxID=434014 RepID=UPI0013186787|nr:TRAP transporter substrate-binding protein DctP [Variovorax sp. PBL-E5]VTU22458.1 Neu5Ac-binding protein [Variovorax sp. PBL-E5]